MFRVEETRDETVLPLAEVKRSRIVAAPSAVQAEQQAVELGVSLVNELKQGNERYFQTTTLSSTELETIDRNSPLAPSIVRFIRNRRRSTVFGQSKRQRR